MAKFNPDLQVPFKNGQLVEYQHYDCDEVQNYRFEAVLKFDTQSRGRSSVKFYFVDGGTKTEYPMFLTDFCDIVRGCTLEKGVIAGTFFFVKRGQNYGIALEQ